MTTPARPVLGALEAIYRRRATRAYTATPVDESTVRELLRAAVHAPTAMHLEPWAFVVIQDTALLKRISDRAKAQVVVVGPEGALARGPDAPHPPAPLGDPQFNIFYNAGTLIVICGKAMGPYVAADCWLAAENLMIAATALGLATCPIGFALGALAEPDLKAEFGIPPSVAPVAAIVVGTPALAPAASVRRPPEILSWTR